MSTICQPFVIHQLSCRSTFRYVDLKAPLLPYPSPETSCPLLPARITHEKSTAFTDLDHLDKNPIFNFAILLSYAMHGLSSSPVAKLLLPLYTLIPVAIAQISSDASSTSSRLTTMSTTKPLPTLPALSTITGSSSPTTFPPTCSDSGIDCRHDPNNDGHGISSYYFIFLAIIICAAGLATFFVWRKKRRARHWDHTGRANALANDLSAWDPARQRRRYRQGRWRSAELSREEGLNEHGEAPPPYIPKSQEEEQAARDQPGVAGPVQIVQQDMTAHLVSPTSKARRSMLMKGLDCYTVDDMGNSVEVGTDVICLNLALGVKDEDDGDEGYLSTFRNSQMEIMIARRMLYFRQDKVLKEVADKANWDPATRKWAEGHVAMKDFEKILPPGEHAVLYADGTAKHGARVHTIHDVDEVDVGGIAQDVVRNETLLNQTMNDQQKSDIEEMLTRQHEEARKKRADGGSSAGRKRKISNDEDDSNPIYLADLSNVHGAAKMNNCDQSGKFKGDGSDVYFAAAEYFMTREAQGKKLPTRASAQKKQKVSTESGDQAAKTKNKKVEVPDVSNIHLDGEDTDSVKVFDTCDEVRRKITAHLSKYTGLTKAQFGRDVLSCLHASKRSASIQGTTMDRFRNYRGPCAGATSNLFYGAYVYFEKLRLVEGKPKSKHRVEMEKVWPRGFDVDHDGSRGFFCHESMRPYEDKYGIVTMLKR
nr:hypothetical protein CFP56_50965 [Quercus suber]